MEREPPIAITKADSSAIEESAPLAGREVVAVSAGNIADLSRNQYPAVGYCIYCSAIEGLRREHIVPLGLDGTAVLPAASCGRCAKISGAFEA